MVRAVAVATLIGGLLAGGPVGAAERTVRLAVDNMTCAGCSYIGKKTLASMPGVAEVDASMAEKAAVVTFDDDETDVTKLTEATAGVGFPSRVVK
jgi:mercuric ion binding protein